MDKLAIKEVNKEKQRIDKADIGEIIISFDG